MVIIRKKKIFIIGIIEIIAFLGLITNTYATDIVAETPEVNQIGNNTYSVTISDDIMKINDFITAKSESNILNSNNKISAVIGANSSSYDLRDYYNLRVKNQGNTQNCWAFSLLSSTETNMLMKKGITTNLSERHMNYATSNSFTDGTNENAFNRSALDGGSFIIGLAYLTNGQGAVLESEMPFSEDTSSISLKDIDIKPSYYVTGYEKLPTIYKVKNGDEILYTDGIKNYTDEEVNSLRKIIKQHIVQNGGVSAYMAATAIDYYSNRDNVLESKAYYCDNEAYSVDHAVTIIGWDDNYSKDNFTGASKPKKDGAYIILNSYSDSVFDKGYLYVSYEDFLIESMLYGVTDTSTIDYNNLYQHDEFGANVPITLTNSSGTEVQEGYYASIYSRDNSIDSNSIEKIDRVSISTNQYSKLEIYVNPNSSDLSQSNLQLVATTDILSPGYNTVSFDGVQLTGKEFAVVVKQKAIDETAYFMVEAKIDGTMFSTASATVGDSKVSLDGNRWYNLADLGSINYGTYNINLANADVCVKAFTESYEKPAESTKPENPTTSEISSTVYEISSDNYITKIYDETTINNFLKNMNLVNVSYEFLNKNNEKVTDYESYVTTDMKFKTNDKTYTLVVRGDLNCDGKISLIDVSKHALHYVKYEGYILTGAPEKAADINLDGKFSLTDISQLRLLYVSKPRN